jgi:hypothetical protein
MAWMEGVLGARRGLNSQKHLNNGCLNNKNKNKNNNKSGAKPLSSWVKTSIFV